MDLFVLAGVSTLGIKDLWQALGMASIGIVTFVVVVHIMYMYFSKLVQLVATHLGPIVKDHRVATEASRSAMETAQAMVERLDHMFTSCNLTRPVPRDKQD